MTNMNNTNNFLSLKILDKFQGLFEKIGIDYKVMRIILRTKLVLDSRSAPVIANQNKKKENAQESTSFIRRYLLHLIFGALLAFLIYFIKDEMIRMIYFSGAFFFMTSMYLISDFSYVILDTKDKKILLPKPIDSKVVTMSKVLHVLIYMFRLNLFLAGPSLLAIVRLNGFIAAPIFILEILLMDLLIFLVTAFIYLLILRFFDGELLRNIINLIQIMLTILVTVGYQIAIRMIDFTEIQSIVYNFEPHNYFNPILWFGAPFEILFNGGRELYLYIFTILSIVVPIVCFIIYLSLSKRMESLLLKLEGEGKERRAKHRTEFLMGKLFARNNIKRQAYHFSCAVLRSDRSLKLKLYPALSVGILFPVIMLFNMRVRGDNTAGGYEYLYLYFTFMVFPSVLELIKYSSAWKGAYVYYSSGFQNTKELNSGLLLAVTLRLFIPLLFVSGAVYIFIFKGLFINDILVIMLASLVILPVIYRVMFEELPFSKEIDASNQSKNFGRFIGSIAITGCFVVPHVIFSKINIWIYVGILIIALPVSWMILMPNYNIKGTK